jgi:hypothetical protein
MESSPTPIIKQCAKIKCMTKCHIIKFYLVLICYQHPKEVVNYYNEIILEHHQQFLTNLMVFCGQCISNIVCF